MTETSLKIDNCVLMLQTLVIVVEILPTKSAGYRSLSNHQLPADSNSIPRANLEDRDYHTKTIFSHQTSTTVATSLTQNGQHIASNRRSPPITFHASGGRRSRPLLHLFCNLDIQHPQSSWNLALRSLRPMSPVSRLFRGP